MNERKVLRGCTTSLDAIAQTRVKGPPVKYFRTISKVSNCDQTASDPTDTISVLNDLFLTREGSR